MLIMQAKETKQKTEEILHQGISKMSYKPNLTVIQVGEDTASTTYVRNKVKACERVGMESTVISLPSTIEQTELLNIIATLNDATNVHGILVQLPLPNHINEQVVCESISPLKDVDCFHPTNIGKLFTNSGHTEPCTPRGIITLLKYYHVNLVGARVVIVGRSNIVGKPLATMLINESATVTICNSKTKDLKSITREADIVICAIGKAKFFGPEYFSPNAIVVDVGINRDSEDNLCGDVDFDKVLPKVKAITPVPGGVGPMTIETLLINTLKCYNKLK